MVQYQPNPAASRSGVIFASLTPSLRNGQPSPGSRASDGRIARSGKEVRSRHGWLKTNGQARLSFAADVAFRRNGQDISIPLGQVSGRKVSPVFAMGHFSV